MKAGKPSDANDHLQRSRGWGDHQRIDIGSPFQVKRTTANPVRTDLDIVEVQARSSTGESAIVRFENVYGS